MYKENTYTNQFCFSSTISSLTLRAGSSYHASQGTVHSVSRGFIHGYFNYPDPDWDIAVLEVTLPFALGTSGIVAASLSPTGYYPSEGVILYVSGWGHTVVSNFLSYIATLNNNHIV